MLSATRFLYITLTALVLIKEFDPALLQEVYVLYKWMNIRSAMLSWNVLI